MKLSVIIPVYRVEATLDRCVESVLNQSFTELEVILVDDGSPDHCSELCDLWATKDSRITVIHQRNGGLSAARNAGIDRAQGDYLTFIDSDDYIGEGTLEAVMSHTGDNDLLEYPAWVFYGSERQHLQSFDEKVYTDVNRYWLEARAYEHCYAWNKIYRRRLFDGIRFPEGRVFEDVYTLPLLLKQARQVATIGQGRYYYCDNPQGITGTAQGEQLRMLLDAHLTAGMPMDDNYYLHLLNIQMDVCELTGDQPRLEKRHIKPIGGIKERLKAITNNILGIKGICRISKTIHHFKKPSRS